MILSYLYSFKTRKMDKTAFFNEDVVGNKAVISILVFEVLFMPSAFKWAFKLLLRNERNDRFFSKTAATSSIESYKIV